MYPLDLLEFFEAIGIGTDVIDHLRKSFEDKMPVDDFIHERMLEAIRLYLIVGGMPATLFARQLLFPLRYNVISVISADVATRQELRKAEGKTL